MRKAQKTQLLELFVTLKSAHKAIKKQMEKGDPAAATVKVAFAENRKNAGIHRGKSKPDCHLRRPRTDNT